MKKHMRIFASLLSLILICCGSLAVMSLAEASEEDPSDQMLEQSVPSAFTDVPSDAWYADAVDWCLQNGLMSGTSSTTFTPERAMTRSMLAAVLYRAAGSPPVSGRDPFSDTVDGAYYLPAVQWASTNRIISGYGDGRFGVNDLVTRQQFAAILWRYSGAPVVEASSYDDEHLIASYALGAVKWARHYGYMNGISENTFGPNGHATRAQSAVILYRYLADEPLENNGAGEDVLITNSGEELALGSLAHLTTDDNAPTVYFLSDITPEALVSAYDALGWTPSGEVAVKLSTGEPGSNYLRPELIADLVHLVDGTIVECNTAYGGSRASTAMHYQVAEDHGFTAIADVQIQDENGSMTLPVEGGTVLSENYVGAAFDDYDSYLVLSHFKGHSMAGFGGAIKNISIGLASSDGKAHIHSGGTGGSMWGGEQDAFLEAMGDAGKSVSDYLGSGERIVYINVMNRLSVDCDCDGNPAEPDMHDIGILASADPVALDQACIDLVYATRDGASLIQRIESRNGLHTLENAEEIGLGSREYRLQLLR